MLQEDLDNSDWLNRMRSFVDLTERNLAQVAGLNHQQQGQHLAMNLKLVLHYVLI